MSVSLSLTNLFESVIPERRKTMIFNMPISTFLMFLSWPAVWIVLALVIYRVMAKQDALIDDTEFTTIQKGGGKS